MAQSQPFIDKLLKQIEQLLKDSGFTEELKSILKELSECLKRLISKLPDAVLGICCKIKKFVTALFCFDVNNAMNLPYIDNELDHLVELIGEVEKSVETGAGDNQANMTNFMKLEEAKGTAEDIFQMLKSGVIDSIKSNRWTFCAQVVGGGVIGAAVGGGFEAGIVGATCGLCLTGGAAGGIVLGLALGGIIYKQNDIRIKAEAKMRALALKIQLRQAISSARQLGVYYPQDENIPSLVKELQHLQENVMAYVSKCLT